MKNSTGTILVVVFLLLASLGSDAQKVPSDVKVSHIGPRLVLVTCKDGADPTVDVQLSHAAGGLVVSCGRADSK